MTDENDIIESDETPDQLPKDESLKSDNKINDIVLYTFTPKELDDYVKAKEEKINQMRKMIDELRLADKIDQANKLTDELKKIGEQYADEDSHISKLMQIRFGMAQYDNQVEYVSRLLASAKERGDELRHVPPEQTFRANKNTQSHSSSSGEIKGQAGDIYLLTRLHGFCRVPLYNSGFWLSFRSSAMWELNAFFQSIDMEEKIFGRILGGHYYHLYDFTIKEAFLDLIEEIVVDSSLKDFNKVGVLRKAIALPDINTLFASCCYMLYRDGLDVDVSCLEESCGHISPIHVVLTNCVINNYSLLTSVHLSQLLQTDKESLTLNDVVHYQNTLNGIHNSILCEKEPFIFKCQVANIERYLQIGSIVYKKILSGLKTDDIKDRRFTQYLRSLIPWMYIPWIESVTIDVDTDTPLVIKEPEKIIQVIETLIRQNDPILGRIQKDFIDRIVVSHYCYPGVKCPACGKEPDDIKKDSYPADVESLFFFLSSATLIKIEEGLANI